MGLDSGPAGFFTQDHRDCDSAWAAVEQAVETNAGAAEAFQHFDRAMQRHLGMEEEVLFPALEQATGMQGGPTMVMRQEHKQMRAVLDQMRGAAEAGEFDALLDHGDTLLMLIQQHNMKEEGMLYPLAERMLSGSWQQLAARLAEYAKD